MHALLGKIIKAHGLKCHFCFNDIELCYSFNLSEAKSDYVVGWTVLCATNIQHWMSNNFLKLNGDKTEAILFGSPHQLKKIHVMRIAIGDISIIPSPCVRNLGVVQDCNMTMSAHVSRVCSSAFSIFGVLAAFLPSSPRQPLNGWCTHLLHPGSTWAKLFCLE